MKYRTIVADPPWAYPEGWPIGSENGEVSSHAARRGIAFESGRRTPLKYPSLSVSEIASLPIRDLAESCGCHLYLWTTNRYLRDGFDIVEAWGFRYSQTLVWTKTPMGIGPGGAWAQTTEYVLVASLGSPGRLRRWDTTWFDWPRMGKAHSRKPEAFLDMVEQTSRPPYVELFARRQRLGWDTWGDEALEHVQIGATTRPVTDGAS